MSAERQLGRSEERAIWRSIWDIRAANIEVIDADEEQKLMRGHVHRYQSPKARFSFDVNGALPKPEITLDVGCGLGASTLDRPHAGAETVIGVDFSFNVLRLAQRKLRRASVENVYLVVADATALPFSDSFFDRLTCVSVLQFVSREGAVRVFKECYRVTRDGASIILTVRNTLSPYAITRSVAIKLARLIGRARRIYLNYNSYRWYRRQLIELGAEILTEHSFGLEPIFMPPILIRMIRALEIAIAKRATILRPFGTNYVFEVRRSVSCR